MDDPQGLYDDARIYDILHTPGTSEELDGLERLARRYVRTGSRSPRWLEPACGSGRLVRRAASRGRRVLGFDLHPGMVEYARSRLKAAGLERLGSAHEADMRTFADEGVAGPESVDFVFNTINTFRHLMSDPDALAHLEQVRRVLRPGGVYAVGISTAMYGFEQPVEDVWEGRRGSCRVHQVVQYVPPTGRRGGTRIERVFSHLMITRPSGVAHRDDTYTLRTYSLAQWTALIDRCGLRWLGTVDHAGRDAEPVESGYRVYVLGRG